MKKYLSEEDFKHYTKVLENNWSGLGVFDDHVYPRMFGHKDRIDYQVSCTITEHAENIKVPTFALEAADDMITGGDKFAPIEHA